MDETKTLQMIFLNAANGRVTLSLTDPKDTLTALEVETAMNNIIAQNVINSSGGDLVAILGARIVTRQVTELIAS